MAAHINTSVRPVDIWFAIWVVEIHVNLKGSGSPKDTRACDKPTRKSKVGKIPVFFDMPEEYSKSPQRNHTVWKRNPFPPLVAYVIKSTIHSNSSYSYTYQGLSVEELQVVYVSFLHQLQWKTQLQWWGYRENTLTIMPCMHLIFKLGCILYIVLYTHLKDY